MERFDTVQALIDTVRNQGSISYEEATGLMQGAGWLRVKRARTLAQLMEYGMLREFPTGLVG